jgi:hypothetical protein
LLLLLLLLLQVSAGYNVDQRCTRDGCVFTGSADANGSLALQDWLGLARCAKHRNAQSDIMILLFSFWVLGFVGILFPMLRVLYHLNLYHGQGLKSQRQRQPGFAGLAGTDKVRKKHSKAQLIRFLHV